MINNNRWLDVKWGKQTMAESRGALAQKAMLKSIEVRTKAGYPLNSPICIYDLSDKLNLTVRFVDISMEGIYVQGEDPSILLSALRPLPRRNFTCAHEVGHHVFGHNSKIDELLEKSKNTKLFQPEEFLVDSFAGFLLMPTVAVRKALALRGWDPTKATANQIFTIACTFGVGYETLIDHMAYALKMITYEKAALLLKVKPKTIREQILGRPSSDPLIIADEHWRLPTIDAEVGTRLLLPRMAEAANERITIEEEGPNGRLFRANRPGLVRVYCPDSEWAVFVRISRYQFVGLSKYRHFEEVEDE